MTSRVAAGLAGCGFFRNLLCAALALAATASVSGKAARPAATAPAGQWTLQSDEVDANLQTGDFTVPGRLVLLRGDGSTIDADRAEGNYKKKVATLYGNVVIHDTTGNFSGLRSARNVRRRPATLKCDELQADDVTHVYIATGNVRYRQGTTSARARRARLNDETHELRMIGDVRVVRDRQTLHAKTVTYDTLSGRGEAAGNALLVFPGAFEPSFATPKPIVIKVPKIKHGR